MVSRIVKRKPRTLSQLHRSCYIPSDVLAEIFKYLTMIDLYGSCRNVAKNWKETCLKYSTSIDFDGLSIPQFFSKCKIKIKYLPHAWSNLFEFVLDHCDNLRKFYVSDMKEWVGNQHLKLLIDRFGNQIKELGLENCGAVTSLFGFQNLIAQRMQLEKLTVRRCKFFKFSTIRNIYPSLKTLVVHHSFRIEELSGLSFPSVE